MLTEELIPMELLEKSPLIITRETNKILEDMRKPVHIIGGATVSLEDYKKLLYLMDELLESEKFKFNVIVEELTQLSRKPSCDNSKTAINIVKRYNDSVEYKMARLGGN